MTAYGLVRIVCLWKIFRRADLELKRSLICIHHEVHVEIARSAENVFFPYLSSLLVAAAYGDLPAADAPETELDVPLKVSQVRFLEGRITQLRLEYRYLAFLSLDGDADRTRGFFLVLDHPRSHRDEISVKFRYVSYVQINSQITHLLSPSFLLSLFPCPGPAPAAICICRDCAPDIWSRSTCRRRASLSGISLQVPE